MYAFTTAVIVRGTADGQISSTIDRHRAEIRYSSSMISRTSRSYRPDQDRSRTAAPVGERLRPLEDVLARADTTSPRG
jgi:hypothetical protein